MTLKVTLIAENQIYNLLNIKNQRMVLKPNISQNPISGRKLNPRECSPEILKATGIC